MGRPPGGPRPWERKTRRRQRGCGQMGFRSILAALPGGQASPGAARGSGMCPGGHGPGLLQP